MKTFPLNFLIALTIANLSCKKEAIQDFGSWKLGSKSYNAIAASRRTLTSISFSDHLLTNNPYSNIQYFPSGSNTIYFQFSSFPRVNSTYLVVNDTTSNLGNSEVKVNVIEGNYTFLSTGAGSNDANVSIINGKLSISFSKIPVKNTSITPYNQFDTVTGDLTER